MQPNDGNPNQPPSPGQEQIAALVPADLQPMVSPNETKDKKNTPIQAESDTATSENESVLIDEINEAILEELSKEQFFHGSVPMDDLVPLLKENGDFLVRTADEHEGKKEKIRILIKVDKTPKDYPFKITKTADGGRQITLDGTNNKPNIAELIKFHKEKMVPVETGTNIKLWRAVPRAPWELGKDKLTLGKELGSGANGVVRAGVLKHEGKLINVAVKVTKMSAENKTKLTELLEEARLMRQLKHNNVVAFYGVVMDQFDAMIVMELVNGGGLDSHIKKHPQLTIEDRCSFMYDCACGLYYLHHCRFIHRDVACRNCLIDVGTNVVKISDFGMSKKTDSYKIGVAERTPIRWQAPEVLTKSIYTRESDVFSFGMLCYEVLTGLLPHQGHDIKVIRKRIVEDKFRPPISPTWPDEIQWCISSCWLADPKKRPNMQDTLPILRKYRKRPGDPATTPTPKVPTPDPAETGYVGAQRFHHLKKKTPHMEGSSEGTDKPRSALSSRNNSVKRKPSAPKSANRQEISKQSKSRGSVRHARKSKDA